MKSSKNTPAYVSLLSRIQALESRIRLIEDEQTNQLIDIEDSFVSKILDDLEKRVDEIEKRKKSERNITMKSVFTLISVKTKVKHILIKIGLEHLCDFLALTANEIRSICIIDDYDKEKIIADLEALGYSFNEKSLMYTNPERIPIACAGFSGRTYNAFYKAGFKTYFDLLSISYEELRKIRTMGEKSQAEVLSFMDRNKLMFKSYQTCLDVMKRNSDVS